MDKVVIFIIIGVILLGAIFWVWQSGVFTPVKPASLPEGIVLFYGDGCPHCKDVEDFILQNKIDEKIKITRMEVWHNKSNAALLGQIAKQCGIIGNSVGVPFLYDGNNKCYLGEVDVPNFLKDKTGIK
jgi:hypothetical protein